MKKFSSLFQFYFFPLVIFLICSFLFYQNYVSGTILSGWDTLHPEFNFHLYFERALNGVWMQHQGLGAVASQAHPGELTRLFILFLLNVLLPINFVRYSFFFLCLFLGALGVYFFSKYLISIKSDKYASPSAFLASLFYIFNLTTVQQFYVPLEMFAVHYASLPWLFFYCSKYLRENQKSNLVWFCFITLLSSSMAHTTTLFYVYIASLVLFSLFLNLKKTIVIIFLTLLLNSFWLLPNLYFLKNHSSEVGSSRIHSIFTGEAFSQSRNFGDLENLALSKNFLFNWKSFDSSQGIMVDLLGEWKTHLRKPYVKELGYSLFIAALLGFVVSLFAKSKFSIALLPLFLTCVFFWFNSNPPLGSFFEYLRNNLNLFKEGFRFPFTKFSILLVMILSVWFSYFSHFVLRVLGKVKIGFIYLIIATVALFYFQLPLLNGYLISSSMKVVIPSDYFKMFDWFSHQNPNARVAKLPLQTFWGWNFYSWGYEGAGFTWFGIEQPTLDREFDRWSPYNETFYNQISAALYTNNSESFKKTIEKYKVKYLLLDESVIVPGGNGKVLMLPEIKELMTNLGYKEVFRSGFLAVYETDIKTSKFINAVNRYSFINANMLYSNFDSLYEKFGNYVQQEGADTYPFVNFDNRNPDIKISVDDSSSLILENSKFDSKVIIPLEKDQVSKANFKLTREAVNCDIDKVGEVDKQIGAQGAAYVASSGGVACDFLNFGNLAHNQGYLVRVKGKNLEGRSLKVYLQNWETLHMDLEELLPEGEFDRFFAVYPSVSETKGYTVNLETRSFGKIPSQNTVELVEFYPIDFELMSTLSVSRDMDSGIQEGNLSVLKISKFGTAIYDVKTVGRGILELEQGYEKGWVAFSLKGNKLKVFDHRLVNSWSNGWVIDGGEIKNIWIVFWPQLLEWGGMMLSILIVIVLTLKHKFDPKIPHNT